MLKKTLALVCTFCLLFAMGTQAMATTSVELDIDSTVADQIQPRYTDIMDLYAELTINGNSADVYVYAVGSSNVTKITIQATLQKESSSGKWSTVKSWSQTFSGNIAELEKSYPVSSGTYRVSATATFYTSSGKEVGSDTSGTESC
ncbi:hypothetical protein [Anaeromassilibacillus senegalensis]|uniref:hypothetical protein n=1 Tax=Anaeromassilibacillus senegalensis TaxID=1673717 RepID=UPI0006816037|nr:hypothetical protein [Anaeromassilibacillus senegalensis]